MKRIILLLVLLLYTTYGQPNKYLSSLCMQSPASIVMMAGADTEGNLIGEKLLRSTNGGLTWHEIQCPDVFKVMTFPDSLIGYATPVVDNNVAGSFSIYKTTDGGETWSLNCSWGPLPMPDSINFIDYSMRCEFLSKNTGYVGMSVMTDAGVTLSACRTSNGGESWLPFYADSLVLENLACNRWVILDSMRLFSLSANRTFEANHRSIDGGNTWTNDFNPGFWGYSQYISPIAHTGLVLYASIPAGKSYQYSIVVSHDGGSTWKRCYQFTTESSQNIRRVAFFDSTYGIALNSYSGKISNDTMKYMPVRTTDGGMTWELVPSMFTAQYDGYVDCSLWPDGTGYATNAYEVVKTTDYGASWIPLSIISDVNAANSEPATTHLAQNYPNPVMVNTGRSSIPYVISKSAHVKIALYDMMGRAVLNMMDADKSPGFYEEQLNVSNLIPGVYLITMFTGSNPPMVRRMVVR
jgi:photosystem II stability/assembly factor-like uncharacterized protein